MSKIAEKRTNEIIGEFHEGDYTDHSRHNTEWIAFKKGYDQAMQDFLEKTEKFLYLQLNNGSIECGNIERLIDDFKNHIEEEL